jgi:hypothetical protein
MILSRLECPSSASRYQLCASMAIRYGAHGDTTSRSGYNRWTSICRMHRRLTSGSLPACVEPLIPIASPNRPTAATCPRAPVTDLARSVTWYRQLLDLRLWAEFVEDGMPRGAGLIDPQGRFNIALRDRSVCAAQPSLRGFDIIAFVPASRSACPRSTPRTQKHGHVRSAILRTSSRRTPTMRLYRGADTSSPTAWRRFQIWLQATVKTDETAPRMIS